MIVHGRLILDPAQEPPLGWVAIEHDRIVEVGDGAPPEKPDLGDEDCLISPGFIDAHLHLPQFGFEGCDGLPLLDWLEKIVYHAEERWAGEEEALRDTARAYSRMLAAGTLGYAGFLTSHFTGVVSVLRVGQQLPLRAIVGQAAVDRNVPPELLGQELARLARSERGRTDISVNPRFAVACTEELMRKLAQRAGSTHFIQTHLAESVVECRRVRELFPDDANYTSVYERMGLLGERTLLAHCVHLSENEWKLIAQRRCVVVHCPTANTFLRSGVFNLDAAREHGVRLALGSDVAAGPDVAMPCVARGMIDVAKIRALEGDGSYVPTPAEAWATITRGNALALGFHDGGELAIGAAADLLVMRPPFEIDRHYIGRLLYTWSDDYIAARVVAGVTR
jgi:guanine deaminase